MTVNLTLPLTLTLTLYPNWSLGHDAAELSGDHLDPDAQGQADG